MRGMYEKLARMYVASARGSCSYSDTSVGVKDKGLTEKFFSDQNLIKDYTLGPLQCCMLHHARYMYMFS